MVNLRRTWIAGAALLAVLATVGGADARAEVAAQTDPTGAYLGTIVTTNASTKKLKIWSQNRARKDLVPLNPKGDVDGDLWPTIMENLVEGNHPWVMWSSFNGVDYDLKWARWLNGDWTEVRWLNEYGVAVGDDMDPVLAADSQGRTFAAWWRADEVGFGRIYFSFFLESHWTTPWPVTGDLVDSRYPEITMESDDSIRIDYLTPGGEATAWVILQRPDTITDELNPFEQNTLTTQDNPPGGDEFGQ